MTVAKRWESEDALIADVKPPAAKIKNDGQMGGYEPFADPDVSFDVTKWPTGKPVPGSVQDDTKAPAKEKQ